MEGWLDLNEITRQAALMQARGRERQIAALQRRNLPHGIRWLVDHPRLLRAALRLRPTWKLMVTVGTDYGAAGLMSRVEMVHCRDGKSFVLS